MTERPDKQISALSRVIALEIDDVMPLDRGGNTFGVPVAVLDSRYSNPSVVLSIEDFVPVNEWAAILAGTSTYDATTDLQNAIDASAGMKQTLCIRGTLNTNTLNVTSGCHIDLSGTLKPITNVTVLNMKKGGTVDGIGSIDVSNLNTSYTAACVTFIGSELFDTTKPTWLRDIRLTNATNSVGYYTGTGIKMYAAGSQHRVYDVDINVSIVGFDIGIKMECIGPGVGLFAFINSNRIKARITWFKTSAFLQVGNDASNGLNPINANFIELTTQPNAAIDNALNALTIEGRYNRIRHMSWDWVGNSVNTVSTIFTANSQSNIYETTDLPAQISDLGPTAINTHNIITSAGMNSGMKVIGSAVVAYDYASIAAGDTDLGLTATITGAAFGDIVLIARSSAFPIKGQLYGEVSGVDTVQVIAYNPSAAAIDPVNINYHITVLRAT